MAGPLYLGLDAGGTSTVAAGLDESGKVVFQGTGGPGNIASVGIAGLVSAVGDATLGCPAPASVVACLAGATGDRTGEAEAALSTLFPGARVQVRPDWVAALHASGAGSAAVVIAGTGSAVCSRWNGEERVTLGGGALLGDCGSAFDVVRRYLGGLLSTGHPLAPELQAQVVAEWGSAEVREIAARWREEGFVPAIAQFAGPLAKTTDPHAVRAVDAAMDSLAHAVQVHLDAVGHPGGETVVEAAGGLWKSSPQYMERFRWALSVTGEGTVHRQYFVKPLSMTPAEGAARLAQGNIHGN
ncbi:MAG: N-acetylglucosamine kinase [Fimbriimonadaceae bacterium]